MVSGHSYSVRSSKTISEFPDNGTSIVVNKEYTITVSAISDQETRYPSNPITVSKFSCMCVHTAKIHNNMVFVYSTLAVHPVL